MLPRPSDASPASVWLRVPFAVDIYQYCVSAGSLVARTGISANTLTYASLGLAAASAVACAWVHSRSRQL